MNDIHNPYSPPRAEVSRTEIRRVAAQGPRPNSVNVALFLIGTEVLFSMADDISSPRGFDTATLIIGTLDAAITIMLGVAIARGRNLARIVFLALWLLSVTYLGILLYVTQGEVKGSITYTIPVMDIVVMAVPRLLSLATVILLFGPGRGWFRARDASG